MVWWTWVIQGGCGPSNKRLQEAHIHEFVWTVLLRTMAGVHCSRTPYCPTTSHHDPIRVCMAHAERKTFTFRYEQMWEAHEDFQARIDQHWQGPRAATVSGLKEKLGSLLNTLRKWNKETFGNVRTEIRKLKKELQNLHNASLRSGPSHAEIKINDRSIELYHREEIMWHQRERIMWLSAGDKNTNKVFSPSCWNA